jgi:hypothetical protein
MRCMLPASETEIQLPRMPEPDRREFSAVCSRKAPEAIRMFVAWSPAPPGAELPNRPASARLNLRLPGRLASEPVKAQTPPGRCEAERMKYLTAHWRFWLPQQPRRTVHGGLTFDDEGIRLELADPLRAPVARARGVVAGSPEWAAERAAVCLPTAAAASCMPGDRRAQLRQSGKMLCISTCSTCFL